jgi:hypothetical protein
VYFWSFEEELIGTVNAMAVFGKEKGFNGFTSDF